MSLTCVPLAFRKREGDKQQASGFRGYVYLMPRQQEMMKIRIITVGGLEIPALFLEVFVSAHVSFDMHTFDLGYGRCS